MKGTVPRYFSAVAIAAVLVVAGVQATSHPRFTVDDGSSATSTNYPTEVAFIGNNLTIDSSGFVLPTTTFNLTNVSGVAVTGEVNLTTANVTSEGRYLVRNESSNRTVAIDLVSNTSDITGRIKAQEDITKTDIELRYWLNNSRVDYSGNLINTTGPSVWNSTGEYIYRVNTTSIGKMWIGINSSQGGDFYVASSGDRQPRITDFPPVKPSGNVSGRIVNETGSGVANVTVRVSGVVSSPLLMIERLPYLDRPPIRTEMTNGTGHFNFTGLQSGLDYSVEVTNSSFRRTNHTPFGADISLSSGESVDAGEFQVTSTLGGINATVDAPVAEDVRYGMIAGNRDTGKGYMEPVNGTNNDYFFGNIPNGSYTVMMFRIDTRGGLLSTSFDTKIRSNVTVEKNRNTTLSFAFEEKIVFTGNVTRTGGKPVGGARVTAQNRTRGQYVSAITKPDGSYTLRLLNNTNYTLEARPPFRTSLTSNSTEIHVDAAKKSHDFTLSEGTLLNGTVKDQNGNRVEDAFIRVYNESENVYSYGSADNGTLRVDGLERGIGYTVEVNAFTGGENHTTVDAVVGDFKTRNFTVSVQTANLSGQVTDTSGNTREATVVVEKGDGSTVKDVTDGSGNYRFNGLRQGQFLEITVKPNSSGLGQETDYTYLTGNETINFELSVPTYLEGNVTDTGNKPIGGVSVYAYNYSTGSYGWTETSKDGGYNITSLKPGPHTVVYRKDGYRRNRTQVNVAKGGSTVDVNLSSGESLSGQVLANGQDKDLDGYISFWNSSEDSFGYSQVTNGDYSVSGLKDVNHTVWVSIDGDSYAPKQLTINRPADLGNSRDFSVNTNQGKKLKVTVKNGSNMVVPDATVSTDYSEKRTNSSGWVKFPRQPIGELTVSANKGGYRGAVDEINISGPTSSLTEGGLDKVREKNLTISRINEKKLVVNVTKSTRSGKAVSGATVFFVSNETGVSKSGSAVTGSNGKATVEHLATGSFSVSLGLSEDEVYSNTTTVDSGETGYLAFNGSNYHLGYEVKPQ